MNKIYNNNTILGSASWSKIEGIDEEGTLKFLDSRIIIGNSTCGKKGRIIVKPERHLLSVAPTRSGKSASLIIPNLLYNRRSVLVIDPKGELAFHTAKRRRELGQRVFILDPFSEFKKNYGDKTGEVEELTDFNPFLNIIDKEIKDYVRYIAEALIIIRGQDSHWGESSLELTEGILAWLVEDPESEASLPNFRAILTKPHGEIAEVAMKAQLLPENSIARRKLGRFATTDLDQNKELSSIISTTITQTAFLDDPELSTCLSSTTSDFSLDCLTEEGEGATIYLILPFDKLQSHGRWLRLIVSLAIRVVFRSTIILENPVLFLLDEFGNIGPLPAIASAFTMGAGRQILLWAFIQGLTQLKRDYPDDWEIFIGNSDHITFFSIMDEFTAEYLSKLLGTTTITMTFLQENSPGEQRQMKISGSCFPPFNSLETQYLSRDLLQASEIRRLPEEYGILIHREEPPILYKKIKYFSDPLCVSFAREDPYYKAHR
ncbi:MAG: type IV secretory system conjugative DNA transfer family protein [Chlorobium sp.]|nr:type IV secretory system conjugative DNA transfer family protein [Chlorobium sp.]